MSIPDNPFAPELLDSSDRFAISGAVALVTGGTRGIGRAVADGLASAGAVVTVTGRDTGVLGDVVGAAAHRGLMMYGLPWDAQQPQTADALVDQVLDRHGQLDILVNNAGAIQRAPAEQHSLAGWQRMIETNLTGAFALSAAAGRVMLPRRRGRIVNIASVLAFSGGRGVVAYAASKGGLVQLTRSLAVEWADRGVAVNAIAAGYIETDLTEPLRSDPVRHADLLTRIPAGRFGAPADLIGPIVFLCSPAASYVTGAVLAVDGGWLAA